MTEKKMFQFETVIASVGWQNVWFKGGKIIALFDRDKCLWNI